MTRAVPRNTRRGDAACRLASLVLVCAVLIACGKKGAPLPPFQRIPAPVKDMVVMRFDQEVFAQIPVPTANVDGISPADLARIELYALTSDETLAMLHARDPEDLRAAATLVGAAAVRRPLPPPPPVKDGIPPLPLAPPAPGVEQGGVLVLRETLTPEMQTPVPLPDPIEARPQPDEDVEEAVRYPPIAPTAVTGPMRYYFAVGVSPRGRYGPPSALSPVPLGPTSSAPPRPQLKVQEKSFTLQWNPAPDVRGFVPPTPKGLLPARPVAPGLAPTTYDIYEVPMNVTPAGPTDATPPGPANASPSMPAPLTPGPIGEREFTKSDVTLGAERCFFVRPVDIINGLHVRGPASEVVCAPFTDVFPPAAPSNLGSAAMAGSINLIWEPSAATDLAGYLVLRGIPGGGPLAPLTKEPIQTTTYADDSVQSGVRYIYAIVAVDKAGNRSRESNRQEETAR